MTITQGNREARITKMYKGLEDMVPKDRYDRLVAAVKRSNSETQMFEDVLLKMGIVTLSTRPDVMLTGLLRRRDFVLRGMEVLEKHGLYGQYQMMSGLLSEIEADIMLAERGKAC